MNILSAFFTGVAVAANPGPSPADAPPVPQAQMQVASIPAEPKYDVTPLTSIDVDLYVQIMRVAADYVEHATGEDKAALDYVREAKANTSGAPASGMAEPATSREAAMLEQRAADLSNYDETVAGERGVKSRYDAIKATIDAQVGAGPAGTPAQAAVRDADQKVLAPKLAEIQTLQNEVRGFMYGR